MSGLYYLSILVFWAFFGFVVAVITAAILFRSASRRQKSRVVVLCCASAPFVGTCLSGHNRTTCDPPLSSRRLVLIEENANLPCGFEEHSINPDCRELA